MLYRYDDMLERYGSAYRIDRAVGSGEIHKVARGIYSDERHPDPGAVVCALHPQTVLTMDSAFYLHGLTDVVPELVHVATPRNSTRIRGAGVRQYFMLPSLMDTGVQTMESDGNAVRVFSRERMLVELLRSAGTLPMDYYKELIGSYRRIVGELDMCEVEDCLALYRRSDSLFDMMQREVL
jgi:predicted transcriptional regulator of viral defense system